MEENISSRGEKLDVEFKRYMQILAPYLSQLLDHDVLNICNAWIQRLSNVREYEKCLRNKYAFVLCYQLARGVLDDPFNNNPPEGPLQHISEVPDSNSSTEIEYVVVDREHGSSGSVLFNSKRADLSDVDFVSQNHEYDDDYTASSKDIINKISEERISQSEVSHKQTIICYTCPELMQACSKDVMDTSGDRYEFRANNLIKRLRDIKKENMLLHNELLELKEESKIKDKDFDENFTTIDSTAKMKLSFSANKDYMTGKTSTFTKNQESTISLKLLKNQLRELQEDKNNHITTLANLQEQLDNFNEIKRLEMDNLIAKHKLEIVKIKSSLRGESKDIFDDKLNELKDHYEKIISKLKIDHDTEVEVLKMDFEEKLTEKDKTKGEVINDTSKKLQERNSEIVMLKSQLEDQKKNFEMFFNKLSGTKTNEDANDTTKAKANDFERKMYKLEKSKVKSAKVYENKILYLQREKHLAECSLQLQLVRQRAQVVNEVTEENQVELNTALGKLESKYKDIVAKVQSTAIQRRLQDQLALESVLQAAFKPRNDYASATATNHSQVSGKNVTMRQRKDQNHSFDSEISGEFLLIPHIKLVRNKRSNLWNMHFAEPSESLLKK